MITTGASWLGLLISLGISAIGFGVLYVVVRAAVLSAMLEHTKRTVQAVSIVTANTLTVRLDKPTGDTAL